MPKSLKTPSSVWSLVFRRIVQQLENDPNVKRVVGRDNLRSWKGIPGDKDPLVPTSSQPVVRLTPNPRNVEWYSPDEQVGELWVMVELAVGSLCIDDVADLWDVIVSALQPGGPGVVNPAVASTGTSFELDLVQYGAETGEIVFGDPAVDPQPSAEPEGYFLAAGSFRLRILRSINP